MGREKGKVGERKGRREGEEERGREGERDGEEGFQSLARASSFFETCRRPRGLRCKLQ